MKSKNEKEITKFPTEVKKKLRFYVYTLTDPRNNKVFYVGKGNGDRIFAHVKGALKKCDYQKGQDEDTEKIKIIKEIIKAKKEVIHHIHRYNMDEKTAYEVEAALIDAYPGLANKCQGHGTEYGKTTVSQIIQKFGCDKIRRFNKEDKILIIKIKLEDNDDSDKEKFQKRVYDRVRKWWKISEKKKDEVRQVAAVVDGVVKEVYEVKSWKQSPDKTRWGFIGKPIPDSGYLNKRIPDKYCQKGLANPVIYTF